MNNQEKPIANQPNQIATRVAEFLKAGDLDGIVSMFHSECQIFFPPDEPPKIGHQGVRDVFKNFISMRPNLISTVSSEVINGHIAVLQAEWQFVDNDGQLIAEGNSTEVARRLPNGGWGYYIDCPLGLPPLPK